MKTETERLKTELRLSKELLPIVRENHGLSGVEGPDAALIKSLKHEYPESLIWKLGKLDAKDLEQHIDRLERDLEDLDRAADELHDGARIDSTKDDEDEWSSLQ